MIPQSRYWSLAFASALSAALLAACGGGTDTAQSPSSGQAPLAAPAETVAPLRAAATSPKDSAEVTSTPVDTDRGKRLGQAKNNNVYVVQLADMPVTAYAGGLRGLQATKPAKG